MNNETKIGRIVLGIVLAVVLVGAYFFPLSSGQQSLLGGNSNPGSSFGDPKQALVVFNPTTSTSTSVLNTDGADRIVTSTVYSCSGFTSVYNSGTVLPSTGLIFRMATTSAVGSILLPTTLGNPNLLFNSAVATSTGYDFNSSTTPGQTGTAQLRVWASNSYLTIGSSATSTGTCTIGVSYIQS